MSLRQGDRLGKIIIVVVAFMATAAGVIATLKLPAERSWLGLIPTTAIAALTTVLLNSELRRDRHREEEARGRVRAVEDLLQASSAGLDQGRLPRVRKESHSLAAKEANKSEDDQQAWAALWIANQEQIREYHRIVTSQARHSFFAAIAAASFGFLVIIISAIYAIHAHPTSAAIAAGTGAVATAFAGYLGKTFIRSQEMAASHLREYFNQPVELFRYLTAERSAAESSKGPSGQ